MVDPTNRVHFLSYDRTQSYIDTKSPSVEELMSNLPTVKEDTNQKEMLAKSKVKDKSRSVDRSKVRMELICDRYGAHRYVYSKVMVGAKSGRKKSDMEELYQRSDGGYMYGYRVPGKIFYVQRKQF